MSSVVGIEECVVNVRLNNDGVAICAYRRDNNAYVHVPKCAQTALHGLFPYHRSCIVHVLARLTPSTGAHPWVLDREGLLGPADARSETRQAMVDRDRSHAEVEVSMGANGHVAHALRVPDGCRVYVGKSALPPLAEMASPLPAVLHLMAILRERDSSWYLYSDGVERLIRVERPEWEEVEVIVEIPSPSHSDARSLPGRVVKTGARLHFEGAAAHQVIDLLGGRPRAQRVRVYKPRAVCCVRDPSQIVGLADTRG